MTSWCCQWCWFKVEEIDTLSRFAMVYIDNIKPAFQVKWNSNDDSLPVPVSQPALAAPTCSNALFIGDLNDVKIKKIDELRIDAVVILCPEMVSGKYEEEINWAIAAGVEVKSYSARDNESDELLEVFFDCVDFIREQLNKNRRVLVTCWGGVNRSSAIVIGTLVIHYGMALLPAIKVLMQQRGTVLTNRHFRYLLLQICTERNLRLFEAP